MRSYLVLSVSSTSLYYSTYYTAINFSLSISPATKRQRINILGFVGHCDLYILLNSATGASKQPSVKHK